MIPARFAPVLFGFILSGSMSAIISGIATYRVLEGDAAFFGPWLSSWLFSWMVAFPSVLVVGPFARRVVARLVIKP